MQHFHEHYPYCSFRITDFTFYKCNQCFCISRKPGLYATLRTGFFSYWLARIPAGKKTAPFILNSKQWRFHFFNFQMFYTRWHFPCYFFSFAEANYSCCHGRQDRNKFFLYIGCRWHYNGKLM